MQLESIAFETGERVHTMAEELKASVYVWLTSKGTLITADIEHPCHTRFLGYLLSVRAVLFLKELFLISSLLQIMWLFYHSSAYPYMFFPLLWM
jgi:hypothetical protein